MEVSECRRARAHGEKVEKPRKSLSRLSARLSHLVFRFSQPRLRSCLLPHPSDGTDLRDFRVRPPLAHAVIRTRDCSPPGIAGNSSSSDSCQRDKDGRCVCVSVYLSAFEHVCSPCSSCTHSLSSLCSLFHYLICCSNIYREEARPTGNREAECEA